jgi:hypothetical protein
MFLVSVVILIFFFPASRLLRCWSGVAPVLFGLSRSNNASILKQLRFKHERSYNGLILSYTEMGLHRQVNP